MDSHNAWIRFWGAGHLRGVDKCLLPLLHPSTAKHVAQLMGCPKPLYVRSKLRHKRVSVDGIRCVGWEPVLPFHVRTIGQHEITSLPTRSIQMKDLLDPRRAVRQHLGAVLGLKQGTFPGGNGNIRVSR
jgi:hypothetical protein